ncbi:uroporphyrinogen-III C-methyltransferase [Candidatus Phycosocius spiralis]|uniref:uroporphyrinogen-III C-methyltransferase n=1 Tax=Candidatus Phycosocius spiralis TaxID=2815099 RepID=A0ABQ4PUK1_9PROT|nr:uroporphyrinogen-III C-methyltransferase [Candidatus Phycosocius spiralis]GIU66659.1 uroporphyrin-III C-methyltransferase [Candidatus Phycosocius spiralis]
MTGHVYLVGAGPGAADLLTLRAARLLEQADLIVYDALVGAEILDLAPHAKKLNVGKRGGQVSMDQALINRLLVTSAAKHRIVVRLKGGDPMLFGRAYEEIQACQKAGISLSIVPGISAVFGAASELGISLTQRGLSRSVTFVTPSVARGGRATSDWAKAAAAADTAVLYMGAGDAVAVRDTLLAHGLNANCPVALAQDVSRPDSVQVFGCLQDMPDLREGLGEGPILVLLGDVFAQRDVAYVSAPLQRHQTK